MADPLKVYAVCSRCRGTGTDAEGELPVACTGCGGTGYREVGQTDGADTLDYIKKKIQRICVNLGIPTDPE